MLASMTLPGAPNVNKTERRQSVRLLFFTDRHRSSCLDFLMCKGTTLLGDRDYVAKSALVAMASGLLEIVLSLHTR